ncbi:MAG TPA: SGNH/GDSL hydrolase family protein [Spirochaetota bacterium]|nr:SGNH/GDSL hydrolase family protein [Spirochaetota bacterium]
MNTKKKLLIRGGSIPAGYGVKRTYVDRIRETITAVEVINRSRIRDTSFQGVWTFQEDIDAHKPDILMLHFGIDDAYQPVYRSEFKENMVQIVRLARKRFDPEIILLTSHPFVNPYDMEMIYIYYRTIREVAVDLKCDMVPVHVYWSGIIEEKGETLSDFVQEDCRYPNELGHGLYAEAVVHKLEERLL